VREGRYSDFWRATAAGLLLGSVLIGAVLFSRHGHESRKGRPTPTAVVLADRLPPMRAKDCTDTWTNATSGTNWANSLNWSAGRPPTPDDRACIPDGALVTLNAQSVSIAGIAVEGTLALGDGAVLDLTDPARVSKFEVLVLKNATLTGRSPVEVTGTLSWQNGGVIAGRGPMRLDRHSNTTFDAGIGGAGAVRRPMLAYGRFELTSGAIYVHAPITNAGYMHLDYGYQRGFAAGFLNPSGRPVRLTGNGRRSPATLMAGDPGKAPYKIP
jgi:hypothetical protein